MYRKEGGFFGVNITVIIFFLAAVGAWYLSRAYSTGDLKSDLKNMANDGKQIVAPHLGGQQSSEGNIGVISSFTKYAKDSLSKTPAQQNTLPILTSNPAPAHGAYYGE